MTIYGYARVSTDGQTLAAQDAQLHAAGTGTKAKRLPNARAAGGHTIVF